VTLSREVLINGTQTQHRKQKIEHQTFVPNIYQHTVLISLLYILNIALIVSLVEFGLLHLILVVVCATSGVAMSCLFQASRNINFFLNLRLVLRNIWAISTQNG
jgi:uncharacterized membrane protein